MAKSEAPDDAEWHVWECNDCDFTVIRQAKSGVAPHGQRHEDETGHDVDYDGPDEPIAKPESAFDIVSGAHQNAADAGDDRD